MNLLTGMPPELLGFALPLLFFFGLIVLFAIVWFVCAIIPDHRPSSSPPTPVISVVPPPMGQLSDASIAKTAPPQ